MNARFWIWENDGWIKLTLRPGQTLHWWSGGRHEEGWSSTDVEFSLEDGVVTCSIVTDGVDCDGRLSTSRECSCKVEDLKAELRDDGIPVPRWERVSAYQRDYEAEKAGY